MRPDLAAIRERAEKATEGPWERFNYIGHLGGLRRVRTSRGVDGPLVECKEPPKQLVAEFQESDDAAFAAHARQDIPALLAYIDALESLVREYQPGHKCSCDYLRTHGELLSRVCDCGLAARLAELGLDK